MEKQLTLGISLITMFGILAIFLGGCKKEDKKEELANLTTIDANEITAISAISGGNISNDGGGEITSRGVVWATHENPSNEQHLGKTTDGGGSGLFTSNITNLSPGTAYYVRGYATNKAGTAYGNQVTFSTIIEGKGTFIDSRDGQTYKWVKIGDQVWMAENLNFLSADSWCYGNIPTNCIFYGRLYEWAAVMNGASSSRANPSGVQGVCPPGWHVPSHDEWTQLEQYVCNQLGNSDCESAFPYNNASTIQLGGTNEGNALKSCRQLSSPLDGACNTSDHPRWHSHDIHYGTDAFGFSAIPGGGLYHSSFGEIGTSGTWWSSTDRSSVSAWVRSMDNISGKIFRNDRSKAYSFSVRCVRDN